MLVDVNFISQGRMLAAQLYMPENFPGLQPAILFEGAMTGATRRLTEVLAQEISEEGFVAMVIDHTYLGEDEASPEPWESPSKRVEDLKSAFRYLQDHPSVDGEKIIAAGVSVGAEYLAQACRDSGACKGIALLQGPFDDSQNVAKDLNIPSVVIDDTHLDSAIDETVIWARTLLSNGLSAQAKVEIDWSRADK